MKILWRYKDDSVNFCNDLFPRTLVLYLSIYLNSSLLIVCGVHWRTSDILKLFREKLLPWQDIQHTTARKKGHCQIWGMLNTGGGGGHSGPRKLKNGNPTPDTGSTQRQITDPLTRSGCQKPRPPPATGAHRWQTNTQKRPQTISWG